MQNQNKRLYTKSTFFVKMTLCYILYRLIFEKLLVPIEWRKPRGMILLRWHAVSGYAGLYPARKLRREISVSKRRSQSLQAVCAAPAAGRGAGIDEEERKSYLPEKILLDISSSL